MNRIELQAGLTRAENFLRSAQGNDGGWGYLRGGQSYTEPTCYSLLALADNQPDSEHQARVEKALNWFAKHTNQVGAMTLTNQANSAVDLESFDNWGTFLACYTLHKLSLGAELSERYLKYLLNSRGNLLDKRVSQQLNLNGELQAWSWARGTASWVEPTAYALLALKSSGMRDHERVKTGEAFLLDRACYEGGWNYGNKEVLNVILEPMPTNTCFALLALQDTDRQHKVIQQSVAYLEQELAARQSTLLLSLGALCLNAYARAIDQWLDALLARQQDNGSWRDNTHLTAVAALAIQTGLGNSNIFKL